MGAVWCCERDPRCGQLEITCTYFAGAKHQPAMLSFTTSGGTRAVGAVVVGTPIVTAGGTVAPALRFR